MDYKPASRLVRRKPECDVVIDFMGESTQAHRHSIFGSVNDLAKQTVYLGAKYKLEACSVHVRPNINLPLIIGFTLRCYSVP